MNKRILTLAGIILAGSLAAGCQNESGHDQKGDAMEHSTTSKVPAPGSTAPNTNSGMNDMNGMTTPSDDSTPNSTSTY